MQCYISRKVLGEKGWGGRELVVGGDVPKGGVIGRGIFGDEFADAVGGRVDGRIAPRSGLAVKSFIDTGAGVVDADYRGQVRVLLFNHSEVDFEGTLLGRLGLVEGGGVC